jgi:hypothetical protein
MFQPEELQVLIVGSDFLDFNLLKEGCQYDGGYRYECVWNKRVKVEDGKCFYICLDMFLS